MEIINFISKNNLHGRILGIKMYKWAAVSFSKEKTGNNWIDFLSARRCGTGEDQEVSCGLEKPVYPEHPQKLGQLPASNGGVGKVSGGSNNTSGKKPGKDETRTGQQRTENCHAPTFGGN